jgi:hypothetical protein
MVSVMLGASGTAPSKPRAKRGTPPPLADVGEGVDARAGTSEQIAFSGMLFS